MPHFALNRNAMLVAALVLTMPVLASVPEPWGGPTTGPAAQTGKSVVYIASDFRNGSVGIVYRGLQEAANHLGWHLSVLNGGGNKDKQAAALTAAINGRADAIVFGGFDPQNFASEVATIGQRKIILAGWHAAKAPGPSKELFVNIATDPVEVAKIAASFVIQDAAQRKQAVGVIIFTDSQFSVATAKTQAMVKTIEACQGYQDCKVLSVENIAISNAATEIPKVLPKLVQTYGAAWTYCLAVNDAYFDAMNFPLREAGRTDILNVSAGDGSAKALSRIGWGKSQQLASVAEPLKMQAYQLADELNRAFAGEPPSGYVTRPQLITHAVVEATSNADPQAGSGFEAAYRAIWTKK